MISVQIFLAQLNFHFFFFFFYLDSGEFTERDIEVFRRYLIFCGIGIQNAQLFEMSVQEYRRNQILLNLARSIFEEQNNLECLVTKILTEARELLKCQRCAVFLLDLDCCESVRNYELIRFCISRSAKINFYFIQANNALHTHDKTECFRQYI